MKKDKKELSAIEIYYLIKELKRLENTKVDRIYHSKEDKSKLVFVLHLSGEGKNFLEVNLPGLIIMEESKQEFENPTGFCMMLRKFLEGSILRSINQINFERVIELSFDARTEEGSSKYYIFLELFSKGNIIFCDSNRKILNLLESQHWKDRELKRDERYIYPKSKYDVLSLGEKDFSLIIKDSEKDSIVKTLAIELSLGGTYAEEICLASNVNKNLSPKTMEERNIKILYARFKDIFNQPLRANVTDDNILPFVFENLKSSQIKYYDSFNKAILENMKEPVDKSKIRFNNEIDKINNIINQQEENLRYTEDEYVMNNSKAEMLYKNYQVVDEILKSIREARKKYSWKDIKEKLSSDKKFNALITQINEKNNEITISLK